MATSHRYLIHAGDIQSDDNLYAFMDRVLKNELRVEADTVTYSSEKDNVSLTMHSYDPRTPETFKHPLINGSEPDLQPPWTYKSPYVYSAFKDKKVTVTVGPVTEIYDFGDRYR